MIKIHLPADYFTWERTTELTDVLGRNAEALPIRLWAYCGKNPRVEGKLTHEVMARLEGKLGWWGEKGLAVKALKDALFLMPAGDYTLVVDWPDVGGHILKNKARTEAATKSRWPNTLRSPLRITPRSGSTEKHGSSSENPLGPLNVNDRRMTHES